MPPCTCPVPRNYRYALCPHAEWQIYPHTSFAEEVDFLQGMFSGSAYVHGPLNSDHWYTYVADDCKKPTNAAADRTLNMMMYELEPEVAQNFYKTDKVGSGPACCCCCCIRFG